MNGNVDARVAVDDIAINPADLARMIQAVEPAARLLPVRFVRRAIRYHFNLTANQHLPHEFCFWADRPELLEVLDASQLGGIHDLPRRVLLLPIPEEWTLSTDHLLVDFWKRLFHAAIDQAVDHSPLTPDERIEFQSATLLHEIQMVLQSENRLPPPGDVGVLLREFAGYFLELVYFDRERIASVFPGIIHADDLTKWLESRLDSRRLFTESRLEGAPDPDSVHAAERQATVPLPPAPRFVSADRKIARLAATAALAEKKGNDVRAAISLRQIGRLPDAEEVLRSLSGRLTRAIDLPETTAIEWWQALRPLLDHASLHGFWDVGERLLYELQKVCLDVERKVYAVDLIEWAITLGEQPIRRLLDKPRDVNVLRRLHAAARFAQRALLSESQREAISRLLAKATHHVEQRVRKNNRPILEQVLDEVGIRPTNLSERVARRKIVEELLDLLCDRGFLKMTDVRDIIARNRLKLPDLAGPIEWIVGDPLIRANRKLAIRMDGLYHRGEIYMRLLQRGSSLAFGTVVGRFLVLFGVLPFAGAFVVLEGLHHFVELLSGLAHLFVQRVFGIEIESGAKHGDSWMTSPAAIILVGILFLGLIHWPGFRKDVGRAARRLFWDLPRAVMHSPLLHGLFDNRVIRFFTRYLLTPTVVGIVVFVGLRFLEFNPQATPLVAFGAALLTGTFFRTRLGRGVEERLDETLSRVWRVISVNFMVGLLTLIWNFFRGVFETIEKGMYSVDEWLRFREGESAGSVAFKVIFGMIWFVFTYVFRFAWNLLIEPQINPIKHFPVVTVSHKLILPLAITTKQSVPSPLAAVFVKQFEISAETANAVASTIVFGIPGIFGFLVWELKENWKLYQANIPRELGPIAVGSHGERVRGLLRPGFHSGVIPKTFARLRKAELRGERVKAAQLHHRLGHVTEAIQHLTDRELIAYLMESQRWEGLPVKVKDVFLATNRIRILLDCVGEKPVIISLEERSGWIIGSVEEPGWLVQLNVKQASAFSDTLAELYKLAGVAITREQAAFDLKIAPLRLDCRPEGLLVSKGNELVTLDYSDLPSLRATGVLNGQPIPDIPVADLLLSERTVFWSDWIERWEQDAAGKIPSSPVLGEYRVLPPA